MTQGLVTVFEHEYLPVGDRLSPAQFEALARFHDCKDDSLYSLGYKSVRFSSFVGILRVGNLTIEILPKTDTRERSADGPLWRNALCDMLAACRKLRPRTLEKVRQSASSHSLLDVFIMQFLEEAESLVRLGLARRYRSDQSNVMALKGRLLFAEQHSCNAIHAERWYTEHTVYDRDNPYNGIVRYALELLNGIAAPWMRDRIRALLLAFDGVSPFRPDAVFMERLRYSRNTEHYRDVLDLAWMIIKNQAPDLGSGRHDVFALMFDMNRIFEEYVFRRLSLAGKRSSLRVECRDDENRRIWRTMRLEPDIVARHLLDDGSERVFILDTKWKCPARGIPDEADLRQVFAYNLYFDSARAILVYPSMPGSIGKADDFHPMASNPGHRHSCELYYANLFGADGRLNDAFAYDLIERMTRN